MRVSIQDVKQYHAEIIEGAHKALRVATAITMLASISQAALVSMRNSDSDGHNQILFYSGLVIPSLPLLLVSYLSYLFRPHSVGIQTGEDDVLPIRNQSSQFFMQLVKSRDTLKHINRMTSEKIDDFVKQVSPYFMLLFSSTAALSNTPRFIREIDNPEKRLFFLASYLIHASIIFSAAQSIRHLKPQELRRKECETQVDETLLPQPRI